MNEYKFKVADCYFVVALPAVWNVARLLPSFYPFWAGNHVSSEYLFRLVVEEATNSFAMEDSQVWEETTNDLGHVRVMGQGEGFRIEISYDGKHERIHSLHVNQSFTEGKAQLLGEDETAGVALTSMLRMLYAQTILRNQGISIHASCVCKAGIGYLFLGKSGTGKSTHSEQWLKSFPDCKLLNDDNPILRIMNDRVWVYGSPWSGKKDCYKQECYPVGGIVRLKQATINQFSPLEETNAFATLLPSCSVYRKDMELQEFLYDILIEIENLVPVARLNCLPNTESALLCYEELLRRRK